MYGVRRVVAGLIVVAVGWLLLSACAVLQPDVRAKVREPGIARAGDVVQLYYGSQDAKKEFCQGTVVTVYRYARGSIGPIYRDKYEVGTVKVTKNLTGRFVEGVVIDGQIRAGDVAMHAGSTCPVRVSQLPHGW